MIKPSVPPFRRLTEAGILCVCGFLVLCTWSIEAFQVPTGSMAPTLIGHHLAGDCPTCGFHVVVGRHRLDKDDEQSALRCYGRVACPNCGCTKLDLHKVPETPGEQLLVAKHLPATRPRRWELVVFRALGVFFVKRILGLPGELIEIRDGDLYVNGELLRKTHEEARALRVLVFDNNCQPRPNGWTDRWERLSRPAARSQLLRGTELHLDGSAQFDAVGYRHYLLDLQQCQPIHDEYGYNGTEALPTTPVHDFSVECDVEIQDGVGEFLIGLTDGQARVFASLPVARQAPTAARLFSVNDWPIEGPFPSSLQEDKEVALHPGQMHHIAMAFVDRRVTLTVDGRPVFVALDLPAENRRAPVVRPLYLAADGTRAVVRNLRLYRDLHYTQIGSNAVDGKPVQLGTQQYFVLGDNSPSSDDSRFWPGGGAVSETSLLGRPLLVHWPTCMVPGSDGSWTPTWDFGQVRWLR